MVGGVPGVALDFSEEVEGIGAAELGGVNERHEHVADTRAAGAAEEE
jgi:hypothetical protein